MSLTADRPVFLYVYVVFTVTLTTVFSYSNYSWSGLTWSLIKYLPTNGKAYTSVLNVSDLSVFIVLEGWCSHFCCCICMSTCARGFLAGSARVAALLRPYGRFVLFYLVAIFDDIYTKLMYIMVNNKLIWCGSVVAECFRANGRKVWQFKIFKHWIKL